MKGNNPSDKNVKWICHITQFFLEIIAATGAIFLDSEAIPTIYKRKFTMRLFYTHPIMTIAVTKSHKMIFKLL